MRFSLITATLGRVEEVRCLCVSLSKQTFKDFELYIVDQNEHHELEDIVRNFEKNFIIHYIFPSRERIILSYSTLILSLLFYLCQTISTMSNNFYQAFNSISDSMTKTVPKEIKMTNEVVFTESIPLIYKDTYHTYRHYRNIEINHLWQYSISPITFIVFCLSAYGYLPV